MPGEIKSREDIIQLTDIQSLRALRKQWNVPTGDQRLQTRDDYVRLLLDFYDRMGPMVENQKVGIAKDEKPLKSQLKYSFKIKMLILDSLLHAY